MIVNFVAPGGVRAWLSDVPHPDNALAGFIWRPLITSIDVHSGARMRRNAASSMMWRGSVGRSSKTHSAQCFRSYAKKLRILYLNLAALSVYPD